MLTVKDLLLCLRDARSDDAVSVNDHHEERQPWSVCWSARWEGYVVLLRQGRGMTARQLRRRLGYAKGPAPVYVQHGNDARPLFASMVQIGQRAGSVLMGDALVNLAYA
jgi:hypothetical protein